MMLLVVVVVAAVIGRKSRIRSITGIVDRLMDSFRPAPHPLLGLGFSMFGPLTKLEMITSNT
jgi:hypothetical protein